jgi:hypothetical protein
LHFPPLPGPGIRLDAYDLLNVRSVIVGDAGYDVTCVVEFEDADPGDITPAECRALGFREGTYP